MSSPDEPIVFFEGRLCPASEATLPALSPALTQGPVAYETLRAYWNETQGELFVFRLDEHLRRLETSMRILRFRDLFDPDYLETQITAMVPANGFCEDVHFRLFVYPIEQMKKRYCTTKTGIVIDARPRPERGMVPVSCAIAPWRRGGDDVLPGRVKAMGIRIFVRAAMDQALEVGYDDLILLNERGKVSESVMSNIFLVRRGVVVTPEPTASLLEGITRDSVLTLLRDEGVRCEEREVDATEFYACDEAFLTSTGKEIVPIRSIEGVAIGRNCPGPVTSRVADLYAAAVRGTSAAFPGWRTPVYRQLARVRDLELQG